MNVTTNSEYSNATMFTCATTLGLYLDKGFVKGFDEGHLELYHTFINLNPTPYFYHLITHTFPVTHNRIPEMRYK